MQATPLRRILNLEPWQRILGIMFFAQLSTAIGFSTVFPFLPLYIEDLGTNTTISLEFWAGMVFSGQAFTMAVASPFWGAIADRYGRKLMVQRATFGGTVIVFLMAFATSAEQLVLLRAIQGVVTGVVSATNALVAAHVPRERVGFAMGMVNMALWAGVAVGPLIGGELAEAFGYRLPFIVTAGLLFVAGLMVHFGVHEDFTPEAKEVNKKRGLLGGWQHVLSMNGVLETYAIRFLSGLSRSMIIPITPLFVAALLTNGFTEGLYLPVPSQFAHVFDSGAGVSRYTGWVVGIASATATASAIYLGRLGDRIGHRRIVIGCATAAIFLYIPQFFVQSPAQLLMLQALTGLATGGLVAAPSALLARYTEPGEEGSVYGLDNTMIAGARAIAPLVGAAIAFWFGLRATFLAMSAVFVIVLVVALLLLPGKEKVQAHQLQMQPSGAD